MDRLRYQPPHPLATEIFRAYDIRGIVDEQLSDAMLYHIGLAVGTQVKRNGEDSIAVGADGRLSSPRLSQALMAGLADTGCRVLNLGAVPTPVLYFGVKTLGTASGIMLTGSHNPSNYNGCKIVIGGHTLANDSIIALYDLIKLQDYELGIGAIEEHIIDQVYRDRIDSDVKLARPLKVVLDAGNGIAGDIAPKLFKQLGCDVIPLFCEVDGNFPNHHPDPGKPANLVDLQAAVAKHKADIGLAFDGDGDRVGVITETGQMIYPDKLLMLFAEDVISRNPRAEIIYDVKCTRLLEPFIQSKGGVPTMWKTGHSLIKSKMIETGALLAGEMSGHIFFKERWYGFDDGIYSAVRLCEILASTSESASAMFRRFPEDVSTPEINIQVTEEEKFDLVTQLQSAHFPTGKVSTIDGIRVDYVDGWGLVRASNTTPVLVLRFEGQNQAVLQRIKEEFQHHLYAVDTKLTVPDY
ncbi:MAG: phosphomannomutase/phosphoglucomutase [Parasphingorhabdus sp.]|jgi:phosphomannomutase/phosphoglucomutase|nr:MAG: Phosphomannomutase/phosphoglucomutase [Oceanospirillaceae bacterium UBA2001]|tara:strand:+ start:11022 stop:12422 length:1401 start_codon:yes stop_codon:yes gene_type:complete